MPPVRCLRMLACLALSLFRMNCCLWRDQDSGLAIRTGRLAIRTGQQTRDQKSGLGLIYDCTA